MSNRNEHESIWQAETHDILRGIAGGAIVSMPLLYTMEVWWFGMQLGPWSQLGFLCFAFIVSVGLNEASGFTKHTGITSSIIDSVEAIAIAAVVSTVLLWAAGVITANSSTSEIIGKVLLETVPVSIGVSIANTQFAGKSRTTGEESSGQLPGDKNESLERRKAKADLLDIGAATAGALVFVFNVAPTEEIIMIAARIEWYQCAALIILSLLISYVTIFVADLTGKERRRASEGLIQKPVPETIVTYVVSVAVAMILLAFLRPEQVYTSLSTIVYTIAAIGLPAAIGGAAGRLVV